MIMKASLVALMVAVSVIFHHVTYAASDSLHVELGVYHCDNDSICEVAENAEFCPLDCVAEPPATTTEEEDSAPPQGQRVIQRIIDLFQTYIPFIGNPTGIPGASVNDSGYVCDGTLCTVFTEDLTRSVIVSFEESFGGDEENSVSISPISGEEIAFAWEEGMTMRIMRSPKEFPIDPLSGELVYEGASGGFTSFGVLGSNIMYYSLFPRHEDGSYGDPEFIIVKSQSVPDTKKATSTLVTIAVNTFFVAILGFIGRFIFLLI